MDDFRKYAVKHLGMNSMVLDDVTAWYLMTSLSRKAI